jgi:DNA uptake protein and related DNA-binding proteins
VTLGDRIAIAALASALAAVALGGWLLLAAGPAADPNGDQLLDPFSELPSASQISGGGVVVDVEGGVLRPGLVRLDAGARVADAIAAAGGYSPAADLLAAAAQINLAAILRDGQQVLVPMLGASTGGGGGSGAGNGLVDLNHASPEELDALPGIGPVTVQKIVAARTEQPFGTLDELVQRKVLTSAQLEKIRDLVTVS